MKTSRLLCALLLLSAIRTAADRNCVLELDGGNRYVQLPPYIFDTLQEATVETWVRWDAWSPYSQWFAFGAEDQWRAMGVNHAAEVPVLQFFMYTDKDHPQVLPAATNLSLGQRCHMAAVSGKGGMRFYLNGVLVGENTFAGSFVALGMGGDNYLGRSNWKENAFFHGALDEVRVWSAARSGEEIRAGMGQPLRGDEAGRMELQEVDFDLGQLVEGLAAMVALRCQQQGLEGRVEREGEGWLVHGDEGKLRQVLINLLGNAVKFTGAGEVVLRVRAEGQGYHFAVSDTGPGIAPRQQQAVFEPFQQGDSGTQQGGTGLGLSIARRHVELMGGQLQLESMPGRGARFLFSLRLEPAQGPVAAPAILRRGQVEYEYAAPAPATADCPRDLAGFNVPTALRLRLREAARMHNVTEVMKGLDQLQQLGAGECRLAAYLSELALRFDMRTLLEELERTADG
jgi:hypothetical protein